MLRAAVPACCVESGRRGRYGPCTVRFRRPADQTLPVPDLTPSPADTPMMRQYKAAKAAHPDCLLFFRMGDFYELFFDDAVAAAEALDIALTKRGQHGGEEVPMAGVPVHSHESYLARLIRRGHRVALCDQTESPEDAKARAKAEGRPVSKVLVNREVIRVVTPGTLTEDSLLESRAHNYLVALAAVGGLERGTWGLAAVDISTGVLTVEPTAPDRLVAALARLDPGEVLVPERAAGHAPVAQALTEWRERLTPQPDSRFDSRNGERRLLDTFGVATLDAFGDFGRAEIAAAGALVDYIALTQAGRLPRLSPPTRPVESGAMEIDPATRRNLELTRTLSGDRKGSLLASIDRTVTGAGARLLAARLAAPLTDPDAIAARLDLVSVFADVDDARIDLRSILKRMPDVERAMARLSLDRGGPRDLAAVRDALAVGQHLRQAIAGLLDRLTLGTPPRLLAEASDGLSHDGVLADRLTHALAPDLPTLARDGGFIAPGFDPALDALRTLKDESRRLIAQLQARYQSDTTVSSLKIKHNNVLGYFIEVTSTHADKLMSGAAAETFIHRQTMANAVRFTTVELSDLERRIGESGDRAVALELALFAELRAQTLANGEAIARLAAAAASLDVGAGLADLAVERRYCRPVVDDSTRFRLTGGRHPVVEAMMADARDTGFVPNDCDLSGTGVEGGQLWLLTGPNMAGKSTFLRQNALIAILGQIGCFVPADAAHIGVIDRLFSRVGASDDLARGRSTFMVEMVETAAILNQASPRSLVILDEIGRGTATYDGLSIAWATVEHLHERSRCRGLFATHYHELTALADRLDRLSCHAMRIKEWQGDIVFLHEVSEGAADRSYGIHVARLAGLPAPVIARAQAVLAELEKPRAGARPADLLDDLPLFSALADARPPPPRSAPAEPVPEETAVRHAVLDLLAQTNPDLLTPREAMDLVYRFKDLAEGA